MNGKKKWRAFWWNVVLGFWFTMSSAIAGHYLVPIAESEVRDGGDDWQQALEHSLNPWSESWKPGVRANVEAWLAAEPAGEAPDGVGFSPQREMKLAIHAPNGGVVEGFIDLVTRTGKIRGFAFLLDTAKLNETGPEAFETIRQAHHRRLAQSSLPGVAWFRHMAGGVPDHVRFGSRPPDFDSTFAMFSGSRAVAENLALDRDLILGNGTEEAPAIPLREIPGIRVRAIDWTPYLKDAAETPIDPLALAIPADQHALFCPSMDAMLDFANWLETEGLPVMQSFTADSPYQGLIQRYRAQLGLDLPDAAARQLKVRGVAVTGGDPYFPTGTDVAVVFDAEDPRKFYQNLLNLLKIQALTKRAATGSYHGEGWEAMSFTTPDRAFSSHVMRAGRFVVVANSAAQVKRIAGVVANGGEALGTLDEFKALRHRHPAHEKETAFLFISDATLRRWCGPESRIGASRRVRATAALLDLTAKAEDRMDLPAFTMLGKVSLSGGRVRSETFGTLEFMTPIAELGIDTATEREKTAYETWRRGYESGWPVAFDPIAASFAIDGDRRAMDLTVLPLTASSEYQPWLDMAGKAALSPRARAVPDDASFFLSLAVDRNAEMFREFDQQLVEFLPELKIEPLAWMGGSVSLWLDDAPLAAAMPGYFRNSDAFAMIPAVLRAESESPLKLALFLTALRASIEKSSPGLLTWENRKHGEHTYVVVRQAEDAFVDMTFYYATLPSALLVSLDEIALLRAIEREKSTLPAKLPDARHAIAEVTPSTLAAVAELNDHDANRAQVASWEALPVLNEWKRRHPERDPVELHRERFGTSLRCPGGRGYRWNAEAMTMESVAYGHPAAPCNDDPLPSPLAKFAALRAGLDFEDGGLRVRASMGPFESRLPVSMPPGGDLLGKAEEYLLNDPNRRLIFDYDDYEENEGGEWEKVRKTCTERLLQPEDGSNIRVIESVAGNETTTMRYSLENGLRLTAVEAPKSTQKSDDGFLILPAEIRAGSIHESTTTERGTEEGKAYKAFHRVVIRIVGIERIEVPAGVFEDALRLEVTRHSIHHGGEDDEPFGYSGKETHWYAKGIGLILAKVHSEGDIDTTELMEVRPAP